jgi:uroporphyrin-III C-methyltransferase / precorrin-2 dehydrogenase / sirohydrochlorin ferrochelatase
MHSLPLFMRLQGRPFILIGDGAAADAKRRLLERAGALCVDETGIAPLAIVALEEDDEAEAAVARLRARGILVNAVDRPHLCDFTLPAIVDRSPVIIAIGTGGASAGLAKALRIRLEALVPATLGLVADALAASRGAMRAKWPDGRDRRLAIDAALDPGGVLDPLVARDASAVASWLSGDEGSITSQFHRITILSDDPDALTVGQARIIGKADVIYHHPGIAAEILDRGRADAERVACLSPPETAQAGLILFLDQG